MIETRNCFTALPYLILTLTGSEYNYTLAVEDSRMYSLMLRQSLSFFDSLEH